MSSDALAPPPSPSLLPLVRDVAREAGVSLSTFYEHFADKEQCFLAAYDRVADEILAAIAEATRDVDDPRKALELGIATYVEWGVAHPSDAVTFVVEVHTAGRDALARRAAIGERFGELVAMASRAAARGRKSTREVPPTAVQAVVYTIDGMMHDHIRRGRIEDLAAVVPAAQEVALHILRF